MYNASSIYRMIKSNCKIIKVINIPNGNKNGIKKLATKKITLSIVITIIIIIITQITQMFF